MPKLDRCILPRTPEYQDVDGLINFVSNAVNDTFTEVFLGARPAIREISTMITIINTQEIQQLNVDERDE